MTTRVFGAYMSGNRADHPTPSPAAADQLGTGTRSVMAATDGNAATSDPAPRGGIVFLHVPDSAAGDFVRVAIGPVGTVAVVTDLPLPGGIHTFSVKSGWVVSVFADGANATVHVCMAHSGDD